MKLQKIVLSACLQLVALAAHAEADVVRLGNLKFAHYPESVAFNDIRKELAHLVMEEQCRHNQDELRA